MNGSNEIKQKLKLAEQDEKEDILENIEKGEIKLSNIVDEKNRDSPSPNLLDPYKGQPLNILYILDFHSTSIGGFDSSGVLYIPRTTTVFSPLTQTLSKPNNQPLPEHLTLSFSWPFIKSLTKSLAQPLNHTHTQSYT